MSGHRLKPVDKPRRIEIADRERSPEVIMLRCTSCGAEATAGCNCGVAYKPIDRATEAVKANPGKSDRAIAAAIGVSTPTVSRARKATVTNVKVGKRTGRDGKTRKVPTRTSKPQKNVPTHRGELTSLLTDFLVELAAIDLDKITGDAEIEMLLKNVYEAVAKMRDKLGAETSPPESGIPSLH
jgi:hypothetical protein